MATQVRCQGQRSTCTTTTVPFEAIQANGKYSLLQTIVYVGRNLLPWSDKHLKDNNHSSTSVPDLAPPNSPPSRLEEDGSVFNQFQ
jgi:hypothetical protein